MATKFKISTQNPFMPSIEISAESVIEALDQYIQKAGFGKFSIKKETWEYIKQPLIGNEEIPASALVDLVNGFCKSPLYKITKVIVQEYPQ